MSKTKKKKAPKNKETGVYIKITSDDLLKIKAMAEVFTQGNASRFIRLAALNYIPTKDVLAQVKGYRQRLIKAA